MDRYRVGVDIGGTFTDIVFLDSGGRVHIRKVSSSVEDYAQAIARGLEQVFGETSLAGPDVAEVRHGTTVASNAILENKGGAHRPHHDARLPRRAGASQPPDAAPLRPRVGEAGGTRRALSPGGGGGADQLARGGRPPARARGRRGGGGPPRRPRGRGDRGLPPQLLREPRPRAAAEGGARGARPPSRLLHQLRGAAGGQGVRADVDHRGQRLRHADGGPLSRIAPRGARGPHRSPRR